MIRKEGLNKMKRILIFAGVIIAVVALIVFNKLSSKKNVVNTFAEAKKGYFEITVTASGELIAEQSLDIKGPEISPGSMGGNRGGGHGFDMRAMDLKIQDIVPEGTLVKEDDYIAQLDRSSYSNTLKDEIQNLTTVQNDVEMKVLDTAVALTDLRDDIKNQVFVVEEAALLLDQSKYEPPATIRRAEMDLNREQRALEQKKMAYKLQAAQTHADIKRLKSQLENQTALVNDLQDFLVKFTITAPSSGMVIYKKDRNGTKRKAGSSVNPWDLVIATLPDLSSMLSEIYINEIDISKVKTGQQVTVNVDAFPDKSFKGKVISIANVGEQLPNSDSKMFEVQIKINDSDPSLRPSMTTGNKILIKNYNDVVYIATECVHTGADSIPFVYTKNRTRQIVVLGEANDKNIIVEQGLTPGTSVYLFTPQKAEDFRLTGENLIAVIKERMKARLAENEVIRKDV
jgi:HlyD family secretion protein